MRRFMDQDFLLYSETAKYLYHQYAESLPVIDYHCHISPKDIAIDRKFNDLTEIWLAGDHYKWRAMRTLGIDEYYITGGASPFEKFMKWAEVIPYTLRNPLYHWAHLELKNVFGIEERLCPSTAKAIWEKANTLLHTDAFSCRNIIRKANVEVICTTDDPVDSLKWHQKIKSDQFEVSVLPAWRPDKSVTIENATAYNIYIDQLASVAGIEIKQYDDLLNALKLRQEYFNQMGCRLSDHGLDAMYAEAFTDSEVNEIFQKVRNGGQASAQEVRIFKSALLYELGRMNSEKGWVQQFHVGAMRNNNTRMFKQLGSDTGFDSIGDEPTARAMSRYFDSLDKQKCLAKTIIYNLNPRDNEIYASMVGNFQGDSVKGKMQWGAAWWFLDQKDGIEKQINTLSAMGVLSCFVGMLTDSRSFMSYSRHEYFRRVICNILGQDIERGELPDDLEFIGKVVQDVCYYNAKNYFNF